jgi:hypothetical protein
VKRDKEQRIKKFELKTVQQHFITKLRLHLFKQINQPLMKKTQESNKREKVAAIVEAEESISNSNSSRVTAEEVEEKNEK